MAKHKLAEVQQELEAAQARIAELEARLSRNHTALAMLTEGHVTLDTLITERKQAEIAFREAEARLRQIVQAANVGLWDWDLLTNKVYFSPEWKRQIGYEDHEISNDFSEWQSRVHPEDLEPALQMVQGFLANPYPNYHNEFRFRHKDGSYRWILAQASLVFDEQGRPIRMLGSHIDITERKQAEEVLRERERQLNALINNVPGLVYRCRNDPNWTTEFVSDGCLQLTGYAPDDFLLNARLSVADVIHPDDRERVWTEVQSALADHSAYQITYRITTADGQEKWVWEQGTGIWNADGELLFLKGLVIDVTERKQAENALREREQQLASIYDAVGDVIFYLAVEAAGHYRFASVNWAFLSTTGLQYDQIVGKRVDEVIPEPSLTLVLGKYAEAIREKKIVRWEETTNYPTGRLTGVVSIVPVFDDAGHCTHLVGSVHDITEYKQAQEEIRKLNAELEQRIAERTAQLEAKNRALETFAYTVSHDLKAPLRGMDGYSRLLLEDHLDRLDEEGQTFLRNIRTAAEQMNQLIDDLLVYSRLECRPLQTDKISPQRLVQSLLAEYAAEIEQRGVTATLAIPEMVVSADPDGLAMVLRNLLGNALKFTQQTAKPSIEIGGRKTKNFCILWIRDNGIGFDMKYHDRLFEIFQRLHRTEEYPGTGIGLAIVYKAMQRMGGRVWAESEIGKGATFYLEIPNETEPA